MARAFLIVLDSLGVGGAPDAAAYADVGANTFGHVAEACAGRRADRDDLREGPLAVPHLVALGLGEAAELASGFYPEGITRLPRVAAQWGCATESSRGKDTASGHWEIAGTPVPFALGYFPERVPAFPSELTDALVSEAQLSGILGDKHASGTEIIEELGAEHLRTLKPICYTSADSVFQIAAHEEAFGLERLYEVCRVARRLVDPLRVARVIARPFVGSEAAGFTRTANRKDFSIPPPIGNLLDRAAEAGRPVTTLGKIGDIFAHRATGDEVKAPDNDAMFDALLDAMERLPDGGLLLANFVDFDSLFGHRRDVAGYAAALEGFDRRVSELIARLKPGDLVVFTADHGNDPTFHGTDHTRERVPILAFGPGIEPGPIGIRETFADIGETVAVHLGLPTQGPGEPWEISAAGAVPRAE